MPSTGSSVATQSGLLPKSQPAALTCMPLLYRGTAEDIVSIRDGGSRGMVRVSPK